MAADRLCEYTICRSPDHEDRALECASGDRCILRYGPCFSLPKIQCHPILIRPTEEIKAGRYRYLTKRRTVLVPGDAEFDVVLNFHTGRDEIVEQFAYLWEVYQAMGRLWEEKWHR